MSLYNMVRGYNVFAGVCLAVLHLDPKDVPRFRDAWLSDDGKQIILLTRTGGGNREEYAEENQKLHEVAGFVSDCDDGFDSTFAHFVYNVPTPLQADTAVLADLMKSAGRDAEHQGPSAIIGALESKALELKERPPQPDLAEKVAAAADAAERIMNHVRGSK